jgi:hypothetical protein
MNPVIRVAANENASQRTKNRVREHGPLFSVEDESKSVRCLSGKSGILLRSGEWFGWLPVEEVSFTV